ncbi:MAG: hypothetical protein U0641_02395 [Anaerolineae bacterium]
MDNTFTNNPGNTRNLTGRDVVAGLFHDNASAEQAVRALRDAGFAQDTIGVAVRERDAEGNLVADSSGGATAAGLVGGGVLGGLVGYLLGIGALAIPGIGPIVAGGILATTLAGAAIGAGAGGLIGAMTSLGIPEEEASHFNTGFERGDTLVTVRAGNRVMQALQILEHYGADTGPGGTHFHTHDNGSEAGAATAGALGGGAAGAATGAVIGGPVGAAVGGIVGGTAGAIAGKASEDAQRPEPNEGDEGTAGGAVAGGVAGAAAGTAVAGPVGTIPGALIGGTIGATAGHAAGGETPEKRKATDYNGADVVNRNIVTPDEDDTTDLHGSIDRASNR